MSRPDNTKTGPQNIGRHIAMSIMRRSGESYESIGESFGITRQAVKYQFDQHGVWETSDLPSKLLTSSHAEKDSEKSALLKEAAVKIAELERQLLTTLETSSVVACT